MKRADKYIYPAVLSYEERRIAVAFPDLPGCIASGAGEEEAVAMGREALGLHLWRLEESGSEIPSPSKLKDIKNGMNEVVAVIEVYMPSIRLAQENRSVNRTVTLPAWLNAKATECGVNFSHVLQEALKRELGAIARE